MQQIINITEARNNLSNLVSRVARERKNVVIIRDSMPEAVLIPYKEYIDSETAKEKSWKSDFEKVLEDGRKTFSKWAKKRNIDIDKLTEEEFYDLIDKI